MIIEDAHFEFLAESPNPAWSMRITISGQDIEQRAVPVVATVGDQPVQALMATLDPGTVQGFLSDEPTPGDELRVGYLDQELQGTDITYDPHDGNV